MAVSPPDRPITKHGAASRKQRVKGVSTPWRKGAGLLVMLLGLVLWPATAEARGRRAVPDIRNPRAVQPTPGARLVTVGLTVHMASEDGVPIASRRQIAQWIERANRALQPHGLRVQLERMVSMTGHTKISRARQRRQLASMAAHDSTIHVFVTESLDPPRPIARRRVRGLHWRYHGLNRELRQREFVVVTLGAPKTTLAHEVGHLMGLRHSTADNNIMCSCRRGGNTGFTYDQGEAMRAGARRFLSRQQQAKRRVDTQRYRSLDRARRRR